MNNTLDRLHTVVKRICFNYCVKRLNKVVQQPRPVYVSLNRLFAYDQKSNFFFVKIDLGIIA